VEGTGNLLGDEGSGITSVEEGLPRLSVSCSISPLTSPCPVIPPPPSMLIYPAE
jgi:hypothetical protein